MFYVGEQGRQPRSYDSVPRHEEVKARAEESYARLEDGRMPCDEPRPHERRALLKQWTTKAWKTDAHYG